MTRPVPRKSGSPWLVLAIASAANFLTILDLWVVNIAYPAFERTFAPASLSDVSWILNVYAILLAAFLIPAGRLADSAGRRACFLAGTVLFGVSSLACGFSPGLASLIVARAAQAMAAAMLMPTSLGFVLSAFEPRERGTAIGIWAAVGAAAASSGPVLGGLLMVLSWRWIFFINVPLVLATVVAGALYLPAYEERIRRRIDLLGALLVFGAMALVCTALVEVRDWAPWRTWSTLGAGLLVAAVFVVHVRRHPDPIVAPRLFAARTFRAGAAGIFAYYVGFAMMLVGTTLLLTDHWHFSVLQAAIGIVPGPFTASLVSLFAGRLSARLGARTMVVAGALLFAGAATWLLFLAGTVPDYGVVVLPSFIVWGVANGLIQPTLFAKARAVPSADLASGSAVLTMARQLGSAFGVAGLVAVLGASPAAGLDGLRRSWVMVLATAALTAVAGLWGNEPETPSVVREAREPHAVRDAHDAHPPGAFPSHGE
ncbi:MFS transporter [Pendulispora albinea]|uniref:MFS transporter n=1 Tax=Pendulispora albinea TaxID=2741071 RepID=A0ABZ2LMH5_9BACT